MDKEYALMALNERIKILHKRYVTLCNNKNEDGKELTATVAQVSRSVTLKDLRLCKLVADLLKSETAKRLTLCEDALNGLEQLMEPNEKHRRLKEQRSND